VNGTKDGDGDGDSVPGGSSGGEGEGSEPTEGDHEQEGGSKPASKGEATGAVEGGGLGVGGWFNYAVSSLKRTEPASPRTSSAGEDNGGYAGAIDKEMLRGLRANFVKVHKRPPTELEFGEASPCYRRTPTHHIQLSTTHAARRLTTCSMLPPPSQPHDPTALSCIFPPFQRVS
jgi:hypothetical protein